MPLSDIIWRNTRTVVETFACSIYVDNVTFGVNDDDSTFDLYTKAKRILADGGFNLRKFVSNLQELQQRIELMEGEMMTNECQGAIIDEDKTYTKDVLGSRQASNVTNPGCEVELCTGSIGI